MKLSDADEESLMKWLRNRQEKFNLLKNASFELLSEHPNKTINVCSDGPKILVLPNVSDILYCYTRDQWIDKLWSDLRLPTLYYPIIVLNILIFLFGTTGNIFVCLSVYRNHQLRNVTNYFIVNLAFADFLVILICLPATVVWDLSLTWFFGTIPCKLVMFLQDVSISVSVLTLTAISIDRYYAVCYPLKFKSSLNQAKRIICLIWIVSLIMMAPDLMYLSAKMSAELSEAGLDTVLYSDCNYDWSERSSRTFQFVKTILLYLLPLILMLCAHFKIMQTLQQASETASYRLEQVTSAAPTSQRTPDQAQHLHLEHRQQEQQQQQQQQQQRQQTISDDSSEVQIMSGSVQSNATNADELHRQTTHSLATSLDASINSPPGKSSNAHSHNQSSDTTRNLRQLRFVDSFAGSGHSDTGPLSRQSTATTTNTTSTTVNNNAVVAMDEVGSVRDGAQVDLNEQKIVRSLDESNHFVSANRRKLSKGVSEILAKFRTNKANNCSSFASSTCETPLELAQMRRAEFMKNGSICSTTLNQFEPRNSARGSLSNPNSCQLMMVTMHNKSKLESRRTAAKMLMTIVVMFGICYLPVHLINFLRQFIEDIPQTDVTSTISMLSHCVCYLNSAINPIIYNHMNNIFRAEFRKSLSCLWWSKGNSADDKTAKVAQRSPPSLNETQSTRCTPLNHPRKPSNHFQ